MSRFCPILGLDCIMLNLISVSGKVQSAITQFIQSTFRLCSIEIPVSWFPYLL